jgi:hypothetical protein
VFASLEYIKSSKLISINSSSSRGDGPPLPVAVVLSFVFIRLFEILISFGGVIQSPEEFDKYNCVAKECTNDFVGLHFGGFVCFGSESCSAPVDILPRSGRFSPRPHSHSYHGK